MSLCIAKKAHLGITQMSLVKSGGIIYSVFVPYEFLFIGRVILKTMQTFFDELPIKAG